MCRNLSTSILASWHRASACSSRCGGYWRPCPPSYPAEYCLLSLASRGRFLICLPSCYFRNDVIDDICVRHDLVAIFRVMNTLPRLRTVENQHCPFGRYLKFLRKLHYNAGYFSIQYVIFHNVSEWSNTR